MLEDATLWPFVCTDANVYHLQCLNGIQANSERAYIYSGKRMKQTSLTNAANLIDVLTSEHSIAASGLSSPRKLKFLATLPPRSYLQHALYVRLLREL